MLLHHFTQRSNLASIEQHGLLPGLTPYQDLSDFKAISLTDRNTSDGLGIIRGETLVEGMDADFESAAEHYPAGISIHTDGTRSIKMFDQSEVMLVIEIDEDDQLLTHKQLFDRLLTHDIMKDRSESELAYWNAAIIHSAAYPFGIQHLSGDVIERERSLVLRGQFTNYSEHCFFYADVIPYEKIVEVRFKQNAGKYVNSNF